MVERTRKFGDKTYIFTGSYRNFDMVDNGKDRLKYEAFKDNKLVEFRTIKRVSKSRSYQSSPMYDLYYRYHANVKKRGVQQW
jgi:hypothetical protein